MVAARGGDAAPTDDGARALSGALLAFAAALGAPQADAAFDAPTVGARSGRRGATRPARVVEDVAATCVAQLAWPSATQRLAELQHAAARVLAQLAARWRLAAGMWELFLSSTAGNGAAFARALHQLLGSPPPHPSAPPAAPLTVLDALARADLAPGVRRVLLSAVRSALAGGSEMLRRACTHDAPTCDGFAFHAALAEAVQRLAPSVLPRAPSGTCPRVFPRVGGLSADVARALWSLHVVLAHVFLTETGEVAAAAAAALLELAVAIDYQRASPLLRESILGTALLPALRHVARGSSATAALGASSTLLARLLPTVRVRGAPSTFDVALEQLTAAALAEPLLAHGVTCLAGVFSVLAGLVVYDYRCVLPRWPAVREGLRALIAPAEAAPQEDVALLETAGRFLSAAARAFTRTSAEDLTHVWQDILHFTSALVRPVALLECGADAEPRIARAGLAVAGNLPEAPFAAAPKAASALLCALESAMVHSDAETCVSIAGTCQHLFAVPAVANDAAFISAAVPYLSQLVLATHTRPTVQLRATCALAALTDALVKFDLPFPSGLLRPLVYACRASETNAGRLLRAHAVHGVAALCCGCPAEDLHELFRPILAAASASAAKVRWNACEAARRVTRARASQRADGDAALPPEWFPPTVSALCQCVCDPVAKVRIQAARAMLAIPFARLLPRTLVEVAFGLSCMLPEAARPFKGVPLAAARRYERRLSGLRARLIVRFSEQVERLVGAGQAGVVGAVLGRRCVFAAEFWVARRAAARAAAATAVANAAAARAFAALHGTEDDGTRRFLADLEERQDAARAAAAHADQYAALFSSVCGSA